MTQPPPSWQANQPPPLNPAPAAAPLCQRTQSEAAEATDQRRARFPLALGAGKGMIALYSSLSRLVAVPGSRDAKSEGGLAGKAPRGTG